MKKRNLKKLIDYSKLKFKLKKSMRYDDVGDYLDNAIIVYDMKNPIINNAIMLHEFIEYTLIKSAGIPVSMIDAFDTTDTAWEKHKKEYGLYCKYHRIANAVERHFIQNLGIDWKDYQKEITNLKVKVKSGEMNALKKRTRKWLVR